MNTSRLAELDRAIDRAVWDSMEPDGHTFGWFRSAYDRSVGQEEIEDLALVAEKESVDE